jgi:hypothetical protein
VRYLVLEKYSLLLTIAVDYTVNFGLLLLVHVSVSTEVSLNNTRLRDGIGVG